MIYLIYKTFDLFKVDYFKRVKLWKEPSAGAVIFVYVRKNDYKWSLLLLHALLLWRKQKYLFVTSF